MAAKEYKTKFRRIVATMTNCWVVFTVYMVLLVMYRLRLHRHKNFVAYETCLVISNHQSFMDPPLIGAVMKGHINYLARSTLWKIPGLGTLLTMVGAVSVDRSKPALETFKAMLSNLKGGRSVLMFPEGTRTKTGYIGPLQEGFTMIARRAGTPILPVYVHNTGLVWPIGSPSPVPNFKHVDVVIGEPFQPPASLKPAAQDKWAYEYMVKWFAFIEQRFKRLDAKERDW